MKKKFSDLTQESQEKFIENLMEIKSTSEEFVIEIVKGSNMELDSTIFLIKNILERLEELSASG